MLDKPPPLNKPGRRVTFEKAGRVSTAILWGQRLPAKDHQEHTRG